MSELLKQSVESILSFDAEMFPEVNNEMIDAAVKQFTESFESIPGFTAQEKVHYFAQGLLCYFTLEEVKEIKKKVNDFQAVKANGKSAAGARTGGASLLKELQKVEYFKEGLLSHIAVIKEILHPKPISRTTLAQAEALAQEAAIKRVSESFKSLPEKLLRTLAESTIGDSHLDYTYEELPVVIAHKQITGEVLEPGKVQIA